MNHNKKKYYLIVLWVTGICNLNCTYCYAENACREHMSFETAKNIIDRMKAFPLKIQFAGGEPMLNASLIKQICNYVAQQKIDATFQMQSNGTLIDVEQARMIKQYKIAMGISMDGVPEINDLVRGKSAQVIQGISNLREQGIFINLNSVITKKNIKHLPQLVDFALWMGNIGGIGLDLLRSAGAGNKNYNELQVTKEELSDAVVAMQERSNQLQDLTGRKIVIREVDKAKKRLSVKGPQKEYCYASCGRSIVVLPNGKTYPCGSLITNEYYMGTVTECNTNSVMKLESSDLAMCNICKYEQVCQKGCPSRKIVNGDTFMLDCVLQKTAFSLAEKELGR